MYSVVTIVNIMYLKYAKTVDTKYSYHTKDYGYID